MPATEIGPGVTMLGDGGQVTRWVIDRAAYEAAPEEFRNHLREAFPEPGTPANPVPRHAACVHFPESFALYHAADCLRRALASAGCTPLEGPPPADAPLVVAPPAWGNPVVE